ncbi:cache domain-containing protein [Shewanella nanhaiensis]|uniref:Cache domain-containing protein n=1 Tax=Shewanella nanhaiensis TaxID=2864872 RepID=A0ABS7E3T4_9GAMM|nr:cache domain-containing protein [Shewanella nanhaiensis]MBW8184210.1 cache domain-containing protein [Shewanella nanhaiensis]
MDFKQKIIALSILPLVLSMLIIVLALHYQSELLSEQSGASYREKILELRKQQLQSNIELAMGAISHIYQTASEEDLLAQKQVAEILNTLQHGDDGYFFVYSDRGVNIVHPRQPYRVGKDLWDWVDVSGNPLIQILISNAQQGGGFHEYLWEKPSTGLLAKKLAYSVMLDKWRWMVGTGIYIDDIDRDVVTLQNEINGYINQTFVVIFVLTVAGVVVVFFSGLFLQASERKLADVKLKALTNRIVDTQEVERQRVSRELHDGIIQMLVSTKYVVENAIFRLDKGEVATKELTQCEQYLDATINDVRRISRDLHPNLLEDHGLSAALSALIEDYRNRLNIDIAFEPLAINKLLPSDARTTLYRIAQEALTNIERHAHATKVTVKVKVNDAWFILSISDNGAGFDTQKLSRNKSPFVGIGLRNMAERISYFNGRLDIYSASSGTKVVAKLPKKLLKYSNSEKR